MEVNEWIGLAQVFIALGAAIITIIIFFQQQKQRRKEAAIVLLLQLEEMQKNITNVSCTISQDCHFNIEKMWCAQKIVIDNAWEQYRKILVRKLDREDIIAINVFYKEADTINHQISAIQETIQAINTEFYVENKMCEDLSQSIKPKFRVDAMHISVLHNSCESCSKLYDLLPLGKLKKISKMKF